MDTKKKNLLFNGCNKTVAICLLASFLSVITAQASIWTPITGPTSTCQNVEVTYSTLSGKVGYSWNVTNGTITSGQGTRTITVIWTGSSGLVEVYYQVPITLDDCEGYLNVTALTNAIPSLTGPTGLCDNPYTGNYSTDSGKSSYSWSFPSGGGGTINSGGSLSTANVTITGSLTRPIRVQYTNSNGCVAVRETNIITYGTPAVPVITESNGPPCPGSGSVQTYTTASGMSNYQWSIYGPGPGVITSGGGTSNNSVTVDWNASSIDNGRFVRVSYLHNSVPCQTGVGELGVNIVTTNVSISGDQEPCQGISGYVYSTQSGKSNYSWSIFGGTIDSGQSTNQISVTWTSSGTNKWVSATYTANGCPGSHQSPVWVEAQPCNPERGLFDREQNSLPDLITAGLHDKDISVEKQLNIFPNPVDQNFVVEIPKSKAADIMLLNANQEVLQKRTVFGDADARVTLDTSSVPNGIYMLQISTDSGITMKRILVSH